MCHGLKCYWFCVPHDKYVQAAARGMTILRKASLTSDTTYKVTFTEALLL